MSHIQYDKFWRIKVNAPKNFDESFIQVKFVIKMTMVSKKNWINILRQNSQH